MRYSFMIGVVILAGAVGYVVLSTSHSLAQSPSPADPTGRIRHLEQSVQSLQHFALSSNLRELRKLLPDLGLSSEAQKGAADALDSALGELAQAKVDMAKVEASMDDYMAALRASKNKGNQKECLDKCQDQYDADHKACQNIQDGIDRANCDIAASNRLVNCQNSCPPDPAMHR